MSPRPPVPAFSEEKPSTLPAGLPGQAASPACEDDGGKASRRVDVLPTAANLGARATNNKGFVTRARTHEFQYAKIEEEVAAGEAAEAAAAAKKAEKARASRAGLPMLAAPSRISND